jgi:hypothetical protein
MAERPAWFDPESENSPLLTAMAELRHVCTRAQFTVPHTRQPGSHMAVQAIMKAIDDYAECEMGHGEFFWHKPHSAG